VRRGGHDRDAGAGGDQADDGRRLARLGDNRWTEARCWSAR
jgi:hypothetical protein